MKTTTNNVKQEATVDAANLFKGKGNQVRKQAIKTSGGSKQNYSTTTSCNNLQGTMQQTMPTTSSSLQIINTPTSLANIAQLSGITLLPIGKSTATNKGGGNLSQQRRQTLDPFSPTNNSTSTLSTKNYSLSVGAPHKQGKSVGVNGSQAQQKFSNIQSIQSLAQQLTVTGVFNWNCNDTSDDGIFNVQSVQPTNSQKPKTGRVNNRKTKSQSNYNVNNNNLTNDIPVIPVTEGLPPMFSDLSDIQPAQSISQASFDSMLYQSDLDNNDQFDSNNGDPNNISLIKLMAILNNPALTITAVGNNGRSSTYTNNNNSESTKRYQGPVTAINLIDKEQLGISLPNYDTSNNITSSNNINLFQNASVKDQMPKNRIPQSAANLQKINGPIGVNHNNNSETVSSFFSANNKPEHELSWLSHYTSKIPTSSSGQKELDPPWVDGLSESSVTSRDNNSYLNDKRNDPTILSTSVRNLMMQQVPSSSNKRSSVSVQLLKHIADQAKDNDWTNLNQDQKSILEPECILSVTRNIHQLNLGAKRVEREETVALDEVPQKRFKHAYRTTKDRLFILERKEECKKLEKFAVNSDFNLNALKIEVTEEREVYVSDQHLILESITSNNENNGLHRSAMPEPDEIFINRSKRVMSKIDTMLERKKRRKFERISSRASPRAKSVEQEDAESEDEWSDVDDNINLDQTKVIKTQLPLEEVLTMEKRDHFSTLGLVTRQEKNKLLVKHCQEKAKIFSPLALDTVHDVPESIPRLVDTLLKTGGFDVHLRIESNIKRNDLPLIEGLNRNTSRIKMNYMNVLGLEKRSKRTTLYKVKAAEAANNGNASSSPKPSIDLTKMKNNQTFERPKVELEELAHKILVPVAPSAIALPVKTMNYSSCRDACRMPDKDEYMKSLGLMTPY